MAYEYEGQRGGRGCAPVLGNLLLMFLGGFLLLAIVAMVGVWRAGDRFMDGLDTMFNAPQPTPQVDVRSVVVQQVRGASELTTTIYYTEAVIPARAVRQVLGLDIGETKLLYIAAGEVRGGVDLSEITAEDVEVISDTIRVTLPPARLLDAKIDVNRSYVYDYDQGFLNLGPDAPDLQTVAEQQGLQVIVEKACEQGILESANEEAQSVVTQLLSTAGYREVIVETQPPDECP